MIHAVWHLKFYVTKTLNYKVNEKIRGKGIITPKINKTLISLSYKNFSKISTKYILLKK